MSFFSLTRREIYNRQSDLNLKEYSHIIIVGVGGIGNWVALNCALCGMFKNIILIDDDVVEASNLNRTIFEYGDIGQYKVDAVKNQILRRRSDANVITYATKTTQVLIDKLIKDVIVDNSYYHPDVVVVDCRDDIYEDLYSFNCKLYKVGYDGMNMTIDGNPRLTKVWTQRGGSYTVTPSYVGSAQLIACLLVNDITYPEAYRQNNLNESNDYNFKYNVEHKEYFEFTNERPNGSHNDELGRLNTVVSFNACDILKKLDNNRDEFVFDNFNEELELEGDDDE